MIENDVRAVERVEDQRFLTGEGQYVDDLAFPGMLHAAILRSQTAHGMIRSIDLAAANALTGVHAIVSSLQRVAPVSCGWVNTRSLPTAAKLATSGRGSRSGVPPAMGARWSRMACSANSP